MLPLFALGGLSSFVGGMYNVGKAIENQRYWDTYRKNTHRSPRYPYRSGLYDSYKYFASGVGRLSYGTYMMRDWRRW